MSNASFISFEDTLSGCEFLLVTNLGKSALWNKSEMSSDDLATEVDNWLSDEIEVPDYDELD